MSCDFAVWYPDRLLTDEEAATIYGQLCDGITDGVQPHEEIDAFYAELTARHSELDDIPEEEVDNVDLCPWSVAHDRSPAHVIMCCVWSKANYVEKLVKEMASRHGLAVFDPQSGRITYPRKRPGAGRKWWRK